ncbi:MAG: hypothetical protein U0P82_09330 [Vicinamibacterales bacterium]
MSLPACAISALLVTASLHAQELAPRAAVAQKLDVAKARVYVVTLQPHAPSISPGGHATNRVLVYLDEGTMTRKDGDGPVETISFTRGDVRWRPASGAYVSENTGTAPIRILEIDLKGPPSGPAPTTKLDAPLVDPKHYGVVLENEQVRVLRVHFDPHDVGAQHEHILDRVVIYMNDQGSMKADDVRMAGAAVHTERNDAGTPADRIAVELR